METEQSTQSVFARLMGLDELPQQWPVQKRERVLSEKYLQRVASIGYREKFFFHESSSPRKNTEVQQELKDAEGLATPNRDKIHDLKVQKGEANSDLMDQKMDFLGSKITDVMYSFADDDLQYRTNFNDVIVFPYFMGNFTPKYKREQGGFFSKNLREMQSLPPHLRSRKFAINNPRYGSYRVNSNISRNMWNKSEQEKVCKFSVCQLELKDQAYHSLPQTTVCKPNHLKAENAATLVSSPIPNKGPHSGARKNGRYGRVAMSLSAGLPEGKRQSISPFTHSGKSYVTQKAKSQIVENRKMPKSFPEVVPICNHGKRAETLPMSNHETVSTIMNRDPNNQVMNSSNPLDIYSGDGRENKRDGSLSKFRSSQECFKTCRSQRKEIGDKAFRNNWHMREHKQSLTRVLQPKTQNCNQKNCFEFETLGSSGKNSLSFPCFDAKSSHSFYGNHVSLNEPHKHEHKGRHIANMVTDEQMKLLHENSGSSKKRQFDQSCSTVVKDDVSFSHVPDDSTPQDKVIANCEEGSVSSGFSGTDLDSLSSLEVYQQSPDSVLDFYRESFEGVSTDLYDLKRHLEFVESEPSEPCSESSEMIVSSDEDNEERYISCSKQENLLRLFRVEESRDYSYLVDVLKEADIVTSNLDMACENWHAPDCPIGLSVFETLDEKYGEQMSWKRSDRRLLFDRINQGLMEILLPCMGVPTWARAVSRRLHGRRKDAIEEELWLLLVDQEKEAHNYLSDKVIGKYSRWLTLGDDTENIGIEIEKLIIDELITEIVST